ncbi:MAG: hypothetical protein FWF28_06390 [Micrococcales bacterium]|nr:hypothetical protein [Micrococcales bacterium]
MSGQAIRPGVADELRGHHVLALPHGPEPDELGALAASRFPAARWQDPGGRAGDGGTVRALRLGRMSRLVGPHPVSPADVAALGLPGSPAVVWWLDCPPERGDPPGPGGDRLGLKRGFPEGMPVRDEERALLWLVAVARRLGGSVRIGGTGVVLTPDPAAMVDLVLYADLWLEPDELLALVRPVVRQARFSGEGPQPFVADEPSLAQFAAHLSRHGVSDIWEAARLDAESAAFDAAALSGPSADSGYGVEADLDVDGILAVEVAAQDQAPRAVAASQWPEVVAYRMHWEPVDVVELETERPSLAHRVARARVTPQIRATARALHAAVGGLIVDEAAFPVDPAGL